MFFLNEFNMKRLILGFLFIPYLCLAHNSLYISDHNDLAAYIDQYNPDLKILSQHVDVANAKLDQFNSSFHPTLSLDSNYSDDHKKPFIGFQPSRTQNTHFGGAIDVTMLS